MLFVSLKKKHIALTANIQAKQNVRGKESPSSFLLPSQVLNFTRLRADTRPNICQLLKSRYRTTIPKPPGNHIFENSKHKEGVILKGSAATSHGAASQPNHEGEDEKGDFPAQVPTLF